jgi:hypothetical protein
MIMGKIITLAHRCECQVLYQQWAMQKSVDKVFLCMIYGDTIVQFLFLSYLQGEGLNADPSPPRAFPRELPTPSPH